MSEQGYNPCPKPGSAAELDQNKTQNSNAQQSRAQNSVLAQMLRTGGQPVEVASRADLRSFERFQDVVACLSGR
jgi:hypothetical protein